MIAHKPFRCAQQEWRRARVGPTRRVAAASSIQRGGILKTPSSWFHLIPMQSLLQVAVIGGSTSSHAAMPHYPWSPDLGTTPQACEREARPKLEVRDLEGKGWG